MLARETSNTLQAEQTLQAFINQQEIRDAENKRLVGALADQLRAAAGAAGRLRDPKARPAGCGGGSAADATQTSGLFSEEASGLFQQLTRETDNINVAYANCRADSFTVREVLR